jgi:hypothetical protein
VYSAPSALLLILLLFSVAFPAAILVPAVLFVLSLLLFSLLQFLRDLRVLRGKTR